MFLNNSPTPLEPWKSNGQGTIDWPTAQVFQSSSTALVPKGNLAPPRPRLECLHPRSFQDLFFPSLSHSWCLENQVMEEYGESVWIRGNWKDFHRFTFFFKKTCLLKGAINSDQLRTAGPMDFGHDFYPMGSQSPSPDRIQTSKAFHQAKAGLAPAPTQIIHGRYLYVHTIVYIYIIILRLLYTMKKCR